MQGPAVGGLRPPEPQRRAACCPPPPGRCRGRCPRGSAPAHRDDPGEDVPRVVGLLEEGLARPDPGGQHHPGEVRLRFVEIGQGGHAPLQLDGGVVVLVRERLVHEGPQVVPALLRPRRDDVFLALEVIEERSPGDIGAFRDLVDRRAFVPLLGEELQSCRVQAVVHALPAPFPPAGGRTGWEFSTVIGSLFLLAPTGRLREPSESTTGILPSCQETGSTATVSVYRSPLMHCGSRCGT